MTTNKKELEERQYKIHNKGICKCCDNWERISELLLNQTILGERERILNLITEEINIANKEGQSTSRLTSLYNKIINNTK